MSPIRNSGDDSSVENSERMVATDRIYPEAGFLQAYYGKLYLYDSASIRSHPVVLVDFISGTSITPSAHDYCGAVMVPVIVAFHFTTSHDSVVSVSKN